MHGQQLRYGRRNWHDFDPSSLAEGFIDGLALDFVIDAAWRAHGKLSGGAGAPRPNPRQGDRCGGRRGQ